VFNDDLNIELYSDLNNLIRVGNWQSLSDYYLQRCILTPLNDDVNIINSDILKSVEGVESEYLSIDNMVEDYVEEVSPEILNSYSLASFPKHRLTLKAGAVVILLRNLNLAQGLCNGTRLVITECGKTSLRCRIVSGAQRGKMLMLPKIKSLHSGDGNFAIPFYRYQFPISLAFAMTVNKAQGQSLNKVLVALPNNVFLHGQLYVALSRCTTSANVTVTLSPGRGNSTLNIVSKRFLSATQPTLMRNDEVEEERSEENDEGDSGSECDMGFESDEWEAYSNEDEIEEDYVSLFSF
jgi:ATP-dependent DNA helicase PIF1